MNDPFTIRVFVLDGDPSSVRIIDRLNWTGKCISFPRAKWSAIRTREEFKSIGVYILSGPSLADEELPTIYVGQGDGVSNRIDSHDSEKDFWDRCHAFVSSNNGLNRAHVTWLEHALVRRAKEAARCILDNANEPREPILTEAEKADTQSFLKEVLQILPLDGLHAFEIPKPVAEPGARKIEAAPTISKDHQDTIIVPAQKEGFDRVFIGENQWHSIRISGGKLNEIKYIAAYQSQPVSAITHWAEVDRIVPYGEDGKYRLIFKGKAKEIGPIPFGAAPSGTMQGPRYTTLKKLMGAKNIIEVVGR